MAKLSRDDVLNLARLAKLQLTDEEVKEFQADIGSILGYVEQLHEVDLGKTTPTYQVTGLTNVMRADQPIDYKQTPAELLKNAPKTEAGQIKVRRII